MLSSRRLDSSNSCPITRFLMLPSMRVAVDTRPYGWYGIEKRIESPSAPHALTRGARTFPQVRDFLPGQAQWAFLRRFLERDNILLELAGCTRCLRSPRPGAKRRSARVYNNAVGITIDKGQLTPQQQVHALPPRRRRKWCAHRTTSSPPKCMAMRSLSLDDCAAVLVDGCALYDRSPWLIEVRPFLQRILCTKPMATKVGVH
ncbi:hypothetical protein B0H11DRAFT_2343678 [Mycena galericulata]|nr:hypothetical protein B0H11DRAFT_2343678 [Mycena galericulata]